MQGSVLKNFVENAKRRILEDSHNNYEDYEDSEQQKHDDSIRWEVLNEIDKICKQRGRY